MTNKVPTAKQLRGMGEGDCAPLTPPVSKADQFGEVWGGSTIYLPWEPVRLDAARAPAHLGLVSGVRPLGRKQTPLFKGERHQPLKHATLGKMLKAMPQVVPPILGMPAADAHKHSWHSFRVTLACQLLAAGCRQERVMAICSWQTTESLAMYARMGKEEYCKWIGAAARTTTDLVARAHNTHEEGIQIDASQLMSKMVDAYKVTKQEADFGDDDCSF